MNAKSIGPPKIARMSRVAKKSSLVIRNNLVGAAKAALISKSGSIPTAGDFDSVRLFPKRQPISQ